MSRLVNRYRWLNRNGTEVVVKIGNYMGEDICLRAWDINATNADQPSANAPVLTGNRYSNEGCPAAWLRMSAFGNDNFGMRIPDVAWRIAWRPVAQPDAKPKIIDVPNPAQLPLMPDQDDIQLKRRMAGMTPEQREQALAKRRESQEARIRDNQQQRERADALALAQAAEPRFAREATIRARIAYLIGIEARIERVTLADRRARIAGNAATHAAITKLMHEISKRDAAAAVELLFIRQQDDRMHFEIMIKPCTLTEP